MKVFKKLTSVFLSFMMIIGTLFSYGVSNNISYAAENNDTLTLPITIRDAHMDGFIFENDTNRAFGEGHGDVFTGLVQNTLDSNNKIVYNDTTEYGIAGLAKNIQNSLNTNSVRGSYKKLLYALRGQLDYTVDWSNRIKYRLGSKTDSAPKDLTKFENIKTCYDAAYWMTYYMFRDDGSFTYEGKTEYLTKTVDSYDKLVLNNNNGVYSFSASKSNEKVLYDTNNKLIQNSDNGSQRGGFFPLNELGFGNEYQTKNFAYTLESNGKFVYHKDENLYFDFLGDDDVYLFINKKLALDIGGQHGQESGKIYLNNQCTLSGQTSKTWAQYLGLEEGGIYDFNFFYVERHTSEANLGIKTNIRVYDASAVPQKNAYLEDTKIPYNGLVAAGSTINYEFVLSNTGDTKITDLTFVDDKLGVNLSSTNITLNNLTDINDITVYIGNDKDGYKSQSVTVDQLKEILKNGIVNGQTIKIKGFKYKLSNENNVTVKNIVNYTAKSGDKNLSGNRDNVVVTVASSDKAFVLDYGKPVTYEYSKVFSNVTGATQEIKLVDGQGKYGTMTNDTSNKLIKYTLNKFMAGIDRFTFNEYITSKDEDNKEFTTTLQTNVKMIPATTIYYEDNFGVQGNQDADAGIVYSGNWTVANPDDNPQKGDGAYGYDSSYGDDSGDSNGTVSIVEGNGSTTKAKFNFTGTGFDIVGRTSKDSGSIRVDIYKVDDKGNVSSEIKKSKLVVTEYKGDENLSTLYQIPVLKIRDLDHGKYQAVITVYGQNIFSKNTKFYLDGIRIYNPMGDNEEANNKYIEDKEGYPEYIELRDKLIDSGNLDSSGKATNSVLFIDQNGEANLKQYKLTGPNNEIYLAKNQSVGFKIDKTSNIASIQIGAKSLNGEAAIIVGTDNDSTKNKIINLKSATDMYYDITDYVKSDGIVFVKSTGNQPVSLTQLKITYKTEPTKAMSLMVNRAVMTVASESYTNLKINSASFNVKSTKINRNIVMTVKASKDVKKLSVLDKSGKKVTLKKVTLKEGSNENIFKVILKSPSKSDSKYYYQIIGLDKTRKEESEKFNTNTIVVK